MMRRFLSNIHVVGRQLPEFSQDYVKNEPMFFSASLDFADSKGGEITKHFLRQLPRTFREDKHAYLDSRVHMLMPGWYPCIPGWHHDDVPRNTADGQPNYIDPPYRTAHVMALVNAELAPTEFAIGPVDVPEPRPDRGAIYKQWDEAIEQTRTIRSAYPDPLTYPGVPALSFEVVKAADRTLYAFDCDTFHRGTPAVGNGWRWFGRVSIGRERRAASEIRRQVQVYMPTINAGW